MNYIDNTKDRATEVAPNRQSIILLQFHRKSLI